MQVWIVADVKNSEGSLWELRAVCSSKEKAIELCTDIHHCIWPVNLDEAAPDETTVSPESEYPLLLRGVQIYEAT